MEFLIVGAIALFGVFTFLKTDAPLATDEPKPQVAQERFYHPSKEQVAETDQKLEEARQKEFEAKKLRAELAEAEAKRKKIEEAEKARIAFEQAEQARRAEAARRAEQARLELERAKNELAEKQRLLENPEMIRQQVRASVTSTTLAPRKVEDPQIIEATATLPPQQVEAPPIEKTISAARAPEATPRAPASVPKSGWGVQISSHRSLEDAKEDVSKAEAQGFSAFIEEASVNGSPTYRVKLGPTASREDAAKLLLKAKAIPDWSNSFLSKSK